MNANETSGAEGPEPKGRISPDRSAAPARRRLKSYQLAFLLAAATTILSVISLFSMELHRIGEAVFWPVGCLFSWLPQRWGESTAAIVVWLLFCLLYVFALWLGIVWGFRHSSRGFKIALALCAVASWAGWWGLKAYGERIDWTSGGLNPDRPGFKPSVVLLAGTADGPFSGWETADTARFEIRMRGANYYYAELWTSHHMAHGSWDELILALPEFPGTWFRSRSGSGRFGAGPGDESVLVAQRLWRGEKFIGAASADEVTIKGATERFSKLRQFGPFIEFRINNGYFF